MKLINKVSACSLLDAFAETEAHMHEILFDMNLLILCRIILFEVKYEVHLQRQVACKMLLFQLWTYLLLRCLITSNVWPSSAMASN